MMRMRGDMACSHAPCGAAWRQGNDAQAPHVNTSMSLIYRSVCGLFIMMSCRIIVTCTFIAHGTEIL
jgi:hypothetical protein